MTLQLLYEGATTNLIGYEYELILGVLKMSSFLLKLNSIPQYRVVPNRNNWKVLTTLMSQIQVY